MNIYYVYIFIGLRHRSAQKSSDTGDLDQVIDYHENRQKQITDDMLILTKTLKEQSELANKIIKKDTEVSYLNIFILVINRYTRIHFFI